MGLGEAYPVKADIGITEASETLNCATCLLKDSLISSIFIAFGLSILFASTSVGTPSTRLSEMSESKVFQHSDIRSVFLSVESMTKQTA